MNRQYSLLIFDWDGTLMDSEAHIVACMQAAMRRENVEVLDSYQIRQIIGLGLEEALQTLYPNQSSASISALVDAYRYYFFSDEIPDSELFAGAYETVASLAEQGFDLAIATGKSRRGLDLVLPQSGLDAFFHITRCADETFSKPHPLMLEEILTDYNTDASQALMIGDSIYDLQMANNIKMDALAVSYGVHEREQLQVHNPVGMIDQITDLTKWLNVESRGAI
jgi:phosphoglycolate phosphatase